MVLFSEIIMKRNEKGQFSSNQRKDFRIRVTKDEKEMIAQTRTFEQKMQDIFDERKNKFLTQLQVVFKLFAFGKSNTIYVAKFLGDEMVQTKSDSSNITKSFEVLTIEETQSIFSYFNEESKLQLKEKYPEYFN